MKGNDVFGGFINAGDLDDEGALPPINEFNRILDKALLLADVKKGDKGSGVTCDSCGKPVNFPQDVIEGGGVYYHVNNKNAKVGCGGKIGTGKGKQPESSEKVEKKEDYNDMGRVDKPKPMGKKGVRIEKKSDVPMGSTRCWGCGQVKQDKHFPKGEPGSTMPNCNRCVAEMNKDENGRESKKINKAGVAMCGICGQNLGSQEKLTQHVQRQHMMKSVVSLIEKMEQIEKKFTVVPTSKVAHIPEDPNLPRPPSKGWIELDTKTGKEIPHKAGNPAYERQKAKYDEDVKRYRPELSKRAFDGLIEKKEDYKEGKKKEKIYPEDNQGYMEVEGVSEKMQKCSVNPNKEKAALRVRKAMALVNKEAPMTDEHIAKAFGEFDAAPDILKEADGRPSGDWFEHAMGRASQCSDTPDEFVLKIWYGEGTFEKAKKAETEKKGILGAAGGAGIGAAIGHVPGAIIGGGLGSLVGKSEDEVTKAWEEAEYIAKVSNVLGTAAGAGIGGAVAGVPGAVAGGMIGHELTKPKASPISESSEETKMEKDLKGALAGGIVGGIKGGPQGAVEGAKIGHALTGKPEGQQAAAPVPQASQPAMKSADVNKISRGAAAALGAGVGGLVLGPLGAAGGAYLGHKLGKDKPSAPKASTTMNVKESSTEGYPTVRSHHKIVAKAMIKAKCAKICKDMAGNENEITTNQLGRAFVQSIIEIAGSGDVSKSAEALGAVVEEMLEKGLFDMDKAVAEPYDNTKIIPKKNADASQEEDRVSSGTHMKTKDFEPSKTNVSH